MPAYALTIFIGAFLLFQVQPLIGKYILPWFGGGPGVWTTCMLFFQVLLLGGYAYAHLLSSRLKPRAQGIVHLTLLAAALALLPIIPSDSWKPHNSENPTLQILVLLTATLGLPYFVLSSTGPLMQRWFSRARPGASPYRLYALSNLGSLLALISYPVYFETHFTRKAQAWLWGAGLLVYVIACAFCAIRLWKPSPAESASANEPGAGGPDSPAASLGQRLLWLLLPACASVLLLATTNKLCQDVAVIPFLWVLPLALYLLSFVICFDSPRWYKRFPFALALVAAMAGVCWALFQGTDLSLYRQVGLLSGGLFVCCMVCHGELYRLRPPPAELTAFYLMIAAGGALGGLFVAVVAPLIFTDYFEMHWGLLFCAALFTVVCARAGGRERQPDSQNRTWDENRWLACTLPLVAFWGLDYTLARLAENHQSIPKGFLTGIRISMWAGLVVLLALWVTRKKYRIFRFWRFLACIWLFLGVVALAVVLRKEVQSSDDESVYKSRNFYGVLTVLERRKDLPTCHYYLLRHGRITHGLQFTDPKEAVWPTSYYCKDSGIELAMDALPAGHRRIGVIGLGTGTLTALGQAGDYMRIYEINPQVQRLATSRFTYLARCPGKVEVALGDARLSMEREPPQKFDLLALDAFSSDAIPVHLLTREAFEIYQRHMQTNGIIVVHISNRYLDLEPVVVNLARHFNYKLAIIDFEENDEEWWNYSSTWILLTHNEQIINSPAISEAAGAINAKAPKVPLWTDDFSSLFQILR